VKDHNDAEKACLKKKSNIQKLILNWSSMGNWIEEEVVDMEQELAVLNCLEPPHGINELEILNYEGLQLPHWMTKGRHSCYLDRKFKQIVDRPHFPHLTKMVLNGFYALESISAGPFPSLTEMHISRMRRLLRLSTTTIITLANGDGDGVTTCGNQEVQCCFPSLTTLHIQDCPKLTVTPWFLPSLEILSMDTSNKRLLLPGSSFRPVQPNGAPGCLSFLKKLTLLEMTGSSSGSGWELLRHLTALESLEIISCGELKQLPHSMRSLNSLQKLEISWCDDLCILPEWLEELCSLQILHISRCESLREFPEGIQHLTSLQELHIERCDTLHQLLEVGPGCLLSLRCLWIEKLPSLSCLPQSMQHLVSLQELHIEGCHALQQLPEGLGELFSLRRLWIEKLPGLTCLPQSICGLASLQELHIEGCHSLHQLPERLGELRSLRHLWVDRITCLPESMRGLTSLIYLTICHSDALQWLPQDLGELSSLQTLNIWDLPALTCLPESMQHLTSLRCLRISSCDNLTVLPESIGQLSALRFLYVWNCPSLTSLPGSIQHLADLRVLRVTINPHLAKRYKREGEDWHLISHIPDVLIE
jgi:Leucine-rich repeat (LRR) protein